MYATTSFTSASVIFLSYAGFSLLPLDAASARHPDWVTPRQSQFPTANREADGQGDGYFKVAR